MIASLNTYQGYSGREGGSDCPTTVDWRKVPWQHFDNEGNE